jgi:type II secretory pathway component PulK
MSGKLSEYKSPGKQKGLALLTAILIVAVVAASAVYLIDSGYTVMRKTQQRIENEQFNLLANAVETYGVDLLYRDNFFDVFPPEDISDEFYTVNLLENEDNPLDYDPQNDSRFESWNKPHTPEFIKADLETGYIKQDALHITDLNRFFNINNLHFANSADIETKRAFELNVAIFRELVRQVIDDDFGADPDEITDQVIDWLDHDDDSRAEILFTEDDVYRRADSLYRPANRPISSIGELEHVLGMTPELMAKLSEYLVALPVYMTNFAPFKQAFSPSKQGAQGFDGANRPELTRLNINTAPSELLAGLFEAYNNKSALAVILQNQGRFQNVVNRPDALNFVTVFTNSIPQTPDLDLNQIEQSLRMVANEYSQFFLIESFFQKENGISFDLETLVFKDVTQFQSRPFVIQRQYDWLPLTELNSDKEDDGESK